MNLVAESAAELEQAQDPLKRALDEVKQLKKKIHEENELLRMVSEKQIEPKADYA